jgi:hypothetical protein
MTQRMPPPPPPTARPLGDTGRVGPVRIVIEAELNVPATSGYARRVNNLLIDLKRSIEEEAPWLANVTINVKR